MKNGELIKVKPWEETYVCKIGTFLKISFQDMNLLSHIKDLHEKSEQVTYLGYSTSTWERGWDTALASYSDAVISCSFLSFSSAC
jgi:hypothetical protein